MASIASKLLKMQIRMVRPILRKFDIEGDRKGQDKLGELGARSLADKVRFEPAEGLETEGDWAVPACEAAERQVILYLHGGGYTAGTLAYAHGFGSLLAAETGRRTLCIGYRLAPEHPFPAALEDAFAAYRYLLRQGYSPKNISFVGESAGGGLCYCLALKLKQEALRQPACIVALSPWVDLAMRGSSYLNNIERDPSLFADALRGYAKMYGGGDLENPLVSPVYGDLRGLAPSLILAGGDELLLDDARTMCERLSISGCESELHVEPEMWHVYALFGTPEARQAIKRICSFLGERAPSDGR